MRSSALKHELINRIIVISRKPHGNVTSIQKISKCRVLPVPSTEVVSDAVDLLSSQSWPRHSMWHAVHSMAASQSLDIISQHHLARLYELVSGKHEEKQNEGRVENLRSAYRQVKEENSSLTVQREGETRKSEWKERGDEERVMCLSALVPVLAAHHTLYPMALSALQEIMISRVGLSPECEQSLLHICWDDPDKLTHLTKTARTHGHRFSRSYYRGALCKVLEQRIDRTETRGESAVQEIPSVAGELLAMMSGDWDRRAVEADVVWLALHLARDQSQVQAIREDLHSSEHLSDESVSVELVCASLRTAQRLNYSNPRYCQPDPSHAVSTLVSCLPSPQPSLSARAFEKVLIACSDTLQLRKSYETFTCMTLTHGLAPTRPGLQGVARLLCSPLFSSNRQWRRFRLAFSFRILEASVSTFGGVVPGWVYAECARPFTELLGLHGFQLMYDLSQSAVIREHDNEATVVMNELWNRGLYHALLQSCRVNHSPQLAIHLLNHMTERGITPNERTFRHLLKFSVSRVNIDHYMGALARHMCSLSSEEMANLREPLYSLIRSSISDTVSDSVLEVVVTSIVGQLLETVSSQGTDEQCISHLASLSGVSPSSISDTTHSDISGECDYVSINRALA